jgi:hypothetical protein
VIPLHILISRHFETIHYSKMWLDSLYPILSEKYDVKITWFFYGPKKINLIKEKYENIVYFQDYVDANQVINELKPDLIIENEFPTVIDMAFFAASKNKIPFIRKSITTLKNDYTVKDIFNRLPTLMKTNQAITPGVNNPPMLRQKFFLTKLNFLIKTLIKSQLNFFEKLNIIKISLKWIISPKSPFINSNVQADLEIINSKSMFDTYVKNGYLPSNLVICGNPIFDSMFKKQKLDYSKPSKKIKILCIPTHPEIKEIDYTIKNIIEYIGKEKDKFSISIKIHPTSHPYDYFENLLSSTDNSIKLYQKGTVEKFVEDADMIISFGRMTSALVYPLLFKKPLIFCNFFDLPISNELNDISFICKEPKNLQNLILYAIESNPLKYDNIEKYLNNFYNKDKPASICIVSTIEKLLKNNSP